MKPCDLAGGTLVAVVDDDESAVDGMRALFGAWGARVAGGAHAGSVLDALGVLESYPDLVVAGPAPRRRRDRHQRIVRLRDELGAAIPAMIVSGDVSVRAMRDAHGAGLTLRRKPVDATALHVAASAFIARGLPAESRMR